MPYKTVIHLSTIIYDDEGEAQQDALTLRNILDCQVDIVECDEDGKEISHISKEQYANLSEDQIKEQIARCDQYM